MALLNLALNGVNTLCFKYPNCTTLILSICLYLKKKIILKSNASCLRSPSDFHEKYTVPHNAVKPSLRDTKRAGGKDHVGTKTFSVNFKTNLLGILSFQVNCLK